MNIMTRHVPDNWRLEKLGQLFEERKEKVSDKEYAPLSVTKQGIVPQMEHVAKSDDSDNRKRVAAGDFVINSRSDRRGSSGLSELNGSVSLINMVLKPRHGHPRFIHHLMRSYAFQEEFYRFGHGIVADLWTTRYSELKGIIVALPDEKTQKEIADFLDRETARIDQLIEKKERLQETIQEKKNSLVIYGCLGIGSERATTISDNKNIIQELVHGYKTPKNWKINKVHNIFNLRKNNKNIGMIEENLLSLSYGNIVRKDINNNEGLLPESYETYQIVQPGDIVLRLTDLQNDKRSIRQGLVKERGIVTSAYDAVFVGANHDPRFWAYTLLSLDLAKYYYSLGGGVRQSIKFKDIPNIWIKVPDREEQATIADKIDLEVDRVDQLTRRTKESIGLLKQFKSALVTEAVTGRLDIKAWKKKGGTDKRLDNIAEAMADGNLKRGAAC